VSGIAGRAVSSDRLLAPISCVSRLRSAA
jgi:hypothetical protein